MQQQNLINKIATIENLILAWRKVEQSFHHGDVWYDEIEIAKFKFNLVNNLKDIKKKIQNNKYRLKPIYPAPYPKANDEEGKTRIRQSFLISIEDQVVWMAVVNIIGKDFEKEMPAWSYGNRLNVSMWKENNEWKFGDIRNTSTRFYRKWNQSWPLYRRNLSLSIKLMAFKSIEQIPNKTEEDIKAINNNNSVEEKYNYIKLKYLEKDYFTNNTQSKHLDKLYWAGIDLEKFYQFANLKKTASIICERFSDDEEFANFIKKICDFHIDTLNYTSKDLQDMQLDKEFTGIPTGLVVAGFLANVFLLNIDKEIEKKLETHRDIIHFRYVDDHLFVSSSFKDLKQWISDYIEILGKNGLKINEEKIEPKGLNDLLKNSTNSIEDEEIIKKISIDPLYPSPLMTETLQKVSELSDINLDLLSDKEFEMVYKDLQMLMVTDIPEQEIKKSTRISFACSMLTRMVSDWDCDLEKVYELRKEWIERVNKYKEGKDDNGEKNKYKASLYKLAFSNGAKNEESEINKIETNLDISVLNELNDVLTDGEKSSKDKKTRIFNLLRKAILEIPDKSKIWLRALDFCTYNCPEKIKDLFFILKKVENEKQLHELGCEYIYAMLHLHMAQNILLSINRLLRNEYSSPSNKETDLTYLREINTLHIKENNHYMLKDSLVLFHKAVSLYNNLKDYIKQKTDKINLGDFVDDTLYKDKPLPFNFWMLWCIDKFDKKVHIKPQKMSRIFENNIKDICPKKEFFLPLLCRCLPLFSEDDLCKINFNNEKYELPKDFNKYEFFYTLHCIDTTNNFMKNFIGYEEFNYNSTQKTGINIYEWIKLTNDELNRNKNENNFKFDVRYSEFFSTKIVLSITEEAIKRQENLPNIKIHPTSIYLKNQKGLLDKKEWQYWRDEDTKIKINFKYIKHINDEIYRYSFNTLGMMRHEDGIIYGIGIIFLQLISKKETLPWIIYRPEFGFEWESVLTESLYMGNISSKNYNIIQSCLSARNREILRLFREDLTPTLSPLEKDIKLYKGLQDLLVDLKESINLLKENMVSVSNDETRQLTIITL